MSLQLPKHLAEKLMAKSQERRQIYIMANQLFMQRHGEDTPAKQLAEECLHDAYVFFEVIEADNKAHFEEDKKKVSGSDGGSLL